MQLHPADLLQPGLAAPVQLADAPRHAGTAHLLVHAERGAHGPLMLEGADPTRVHLVGVPRTGVAALLGPLPTEPSAAEVSGHPFEVDAVRALRPSPLRRA